MIRERHERPAKQKDHAEERQKQRNGMLDKAKETGRALAGYLVGVFVGVLIGGIVAYFLQLIVITLVFIGGFVATLWAGTYSARRLGSILMAVHDWYEPHVTPVLAGIGAVGGVIWAYIERPGRD